MYGFIVISSSEKESHAFCPLSLSEIASVCGSVLSYLFARFAIFLLKEFFFLVV